MRGPAPSRRVKLAAAIAAVLIAVSAAALVLYARGGGPIPSWLGFLSAAQSDPLAPSGPAETVLRTLRLAGYERAVVGDERGTAVLRVEVPLVDTAVDIDITWQTGVAALTAAYPDASRYVVQVFEGDRGLVEMRIGGDDARRAVDADDAEGLLAASEFVFLTTEATDE